MISGPVSRWTDRPSMGVEEKIDVVAFAMPDVGHHGRAAAE